VSNLDLPHVQIFFSQSDLAHVVAATRYGNLVASDGFCRLCIAIKQATSQFSTFMVWCELVLMPSELLCLVLFLLPTQGTFCQCGISLVDSLPAMTWLGIAGSCSICDSRCSYSSEWFETQKMATQGYAAFSSADLLLSIMPERCAIAEWPRRETGMPW
jgi:hypothetical protein